MYAPTDLIRDMRREIDKEHSPGGGRPGQRPNDEAGDQHEQPKDKVGVERFRPSLFKRACRA
jgi:hypothetical protein